MKNSSKIKLKDYSNKKKFIPEINKFNKKKQKNNYSKNFSFGRIKNKSIKNDSNSTNVIKNENKDNIIKKARNPGVDFIRIIAMYIIIINHSLFHGRAFDHFPNYKRQLLFLHCFTDWHNDAFMLISGIIGYKINRYSNLLYLWLTVFLYSVGIYHYVTHFKKDFIIKNNIYRYQYPIIYQIYWYFTTYFGMYLFLPILNKGINSVSRYDFRLAILAMHGFLIFWREYKNHKEDVFYMMNGGSVVWFLILYLTGAFIGKYRVDYNGIKKYIYCFISLLIFLFMSYLKFRITVNELPLRLGNFKINIPEKIISMFNNNHNGPFKTLQSILASYFFYK